jgi:EPS-associated MarR family transcriptional regulator
LNALAAATQPVWLYGCGGSVRESPCKLLKNKTKIQDEARFQILRLLHENPDLTQRELGERVGVSLGAVNYCLKSLVKLGFVKVGNFASSQNKLGYAYVLTPSGIGERVRLTGRFLARKKAEYEALRAEIDALSREAVF